MMVEGAEMDDKEVPQFRALAAKLKYLAGNKPELLFASKCICKNMARPHSEDWLAMKRVDPYLKKSDENGAAIPLDGRRHQSPGLRRLRLGKRPSEHEVQWWCDHAEWTLHEGLVDFAICTGFELMRSGDYHRLLDGSFQDGQFLSALHDALHHTEVQLVLLLLDPVQQLPLLGFVFVWALTYRTFTGNALMFHTLQQLGRQRCYVSGEPSLTAGV